MIVTILTLLIASAPPLRAGPLQTAVPRAGGPTVGSDAATAPAGSHPAMPPGERLERLAEVPLRPLHPSYLSGQPAWLAYDSADQLFYVAVPPSSVEVVPGDFGQYDPVVIATIAVGDGPFGVAYDNATGDVFVTNSLSDNVSVIAGSSMRLVGTIAVGSGPMGVAFDPVTRNVYVANNGSNNVSVISDTRLTVVATVPVGTVPLGVAVDPTSGDVLVANHGSSNVSVISGATGLVAATVALPAGPYAVTVDPADRQAFVTDQGVNEVSAISDTTYSVLANISAPTSAGCCTLNLEGLAYDSGDGLVYVGGGYGTILVILPSNDSLLSDLNFDPAGVVYDPDTGDLCVTNAANTTFECAVFDHPTLGGPYTAQFTESGLPVGAQWFTTVDSVQGQSNGTTIRISVANGSFPFAISASYPYDTYHADPGSGLIHVAGANVSVSVQFSTATYLVDVVETGLPSYTSWTAGLGGAASSSSTDTNVFNVSNGSYELALGTVANYSAIPPTRSVTVNGAALVVFVTYRGVVAPTYPVTFTETGLAAGVSWAVTLNGQTNATTAASLVFRESNGSYDYVVAAVGYGSTPASGALAVDGGPTAQPLVFTSTRMWQITFRETGLPTGTDWGVLVGSEAQTSTSSNVSFARLNGTYGFLVLPLNGYVVTSSGVVVVNGSNALVAILFQPQLYPIVFIELGLPAGANWSVTVVDNATGFNRTLSSTSSSIILFLPNGTYAVSFALPAGYNGTASSTSVTVAGRSATGATVSVGGSSTSPRAGASPSAAESPVLVGLLVAGVIALLAIVVVLLLRARRPPGRSTRPDR